MGEVNDPVFIITISLPSHESVFEYSESLSDTKVYHKDGSIVSQPTVSELFVQNHDASYLKASTASLALGHIYDPAVAVDDATDDG